MTEKQASMLLATLFAAFPIETRNVPPDEAKLTAAVYRQGLKDLDEQILECAIARLIRASERLPTVAKIRHECTVIQRGRRRPGGEAWGDVVHAMKRYGSHRTPGIDFTFDDYLVARAVSAFGWNDLCAGDNATADRARFIELYEALDDNVRSDAQIADGANAELAEASPLVRRLEQREREDKTVKQLVGDVVGASVYASLVDGPQRRCPPGMFCTHEIKCEGAV